MADFERFLKNATAQGANNVPGCVLAAIDQYGASIFFEASGYDSPKPGANHINPDGVFWIASCSKLVGTIAALQCVERGQVKLDDPVGSILPELDNSNILHKARSGQVNDGSEQEFVLTATQHKITLRQLLTHTSGLGYDFIDPLVMAWRKSRGEAPLGLSGNLTTAYKTPLLFEPGHGWAYGSGIDWAGELVARLNQTSLEEYVQKRICEPLGIKSMTFRLEKHIELQERMVTTSARAANGDLTPSKKPWPDIAIEDCAGAGLYSSVPDYMKILHDIISDRPVLLRVDTIEKEMFTPQFDERSCTHTGLVDATNVINIMAGATGVTQDALNWGIGGIYTTKDAGFTRKGTLLWGGYPNMTWLANRKHGMAALYASQVVPPGEVKSMALANRFFEEVWKNKDGKSGQESNTPSESLYESVKRPVQASVSSP